MRLKHLLSLIFCFSFALAQNAFAQTSPVLLSPEDREAGQVSVDFLWRHAMGGTIIGAPTFQAGSVVAVTEGGSVRAHSSSGRLLWNFSARGRLSPFVTRSREGTSYVSRTNGIFIAINRVGRELWQTNIGGPLSAPVVLGWDGRLFVPTANRILCLTASGNLLWSRELAAEIVYGPRLDQNGGIILALENGQIMRFDPFGSSLVRQLPSSPRLLLSVRRNNSSGTVCGIPKVLALFENGDAQFIDFAVPDAPVNLPRLPSPPLAGTTAGENAAIALRDGRVALVSGNDGSILWIADSHIRLRGGGAVTENEAFMLYDERGVFLLTINGVTAFTYDGRRLWYTVLRNASGVPALSDDGILFSGGTNWILYAWRVENRALQQRQTLFGPAPEGYYGTGNPPPSVLASILEFSSDAQIRRDLEFIRREILAGRVGANELEWAAYLMEVASGGVRLGSPSFTPPRIQLERRILALELLSLIGSAETIPWLVRFFNRETELLVRAAAARAIGGIGVDPYGTAMQAFLAAAVNGRPFGDEQVLISVAAATGALSRFSGPPLFDTGVRILVLFSDASQHPMVQRQARRELAQMTGAL